MGTVVAAGPGKEKEEMKLAAGDKVVYFKYAGDKMMVRPLPPAPPQAQPAAPCCCAAWLAAACCCAARLGVLLCGASPLRATYARCRRCAVRVPQDDKGTEYVVLHQVRNPLSGGVACACVPRCRDNTDERRVVCRSLQSDVLGKL